MVQWVVGSIRHGGPIELVLVAEVVGMYYPVSGMTHIKDPLLLFPLCISELSFTKCLTPYTVECVVTLYIL